MTDIHFSENVRRAMTINCACGQSYTMAQWPAGHYFVICHCGKPLLSRDGTGVTVGGHLPQTPVTTPDPPADPETETPARGGRQGRHGRAA
jgi:hypothetical protein